MENIKSYVKEIIMNSGLENVTFNSILENLSTKPEMREKIHSDPDDIKSIIDEVLLEMVVAEEDEKLARRLQEEERMMGSVSKRRKQIPSSSRTPSSERKRQVVKRKSSENTGFNRPMILSPALSRLLDGADTLSRPQVVKRIWDYVKVNNLQDPSNKKVFLCDERMEAVFKKKRVDCFKMNKLLSKHLSLIEEVSPLSDSPEEGDTEEVQEYSEGEQDSEEARLPHIPSHIFQFCVIPKAMLFMIKDPKSCSGYFSVQEAAFNYLKRTNLLDSENPTVISLDSQLAELFRTDSEQTSISLFDYIERIRLLILNANLARSFK